MKIDDLQKSMNSTLINNLGESRAYRKTEEQNSASAGEGKSVDSGAAVDFSNTSVEVSKVARAMETISPERTEKINAIKAKIENGTYHEDAAQVADKIIRDALSNLVGA